MAITDHQAKYFAHELTRRFPSDSEARLASALVDADVDLNPHQVDAALFAFRSPLSKARCWRTRSGWARRSKPVWSSRRSGRSASARVLVITPSNLRKQWHPGADGQVLPALSDPRSASRTTTAHQGRKVPAVRRRRPHRHLLLSVRAEQGGRRPATRWDLVVIDEAHRLRNVYKPSNVIANTLKRALAQRTKLLLTATPLQNSLLELFGLVSFIDDQVVWRPEELSRAVHQPRRTTLVFAHPEGPSGADLPSHAATSGYGVRLVHEAPADGRAVHTGRRVRRPPLRRSSPSTSGATICTALPAQPADADDAGASQAAGVVTFAIAARSRRWPTRLKRTFAPQTPRSRSKPPADWATTTRRSTRPRTSGTTTTRSHPLIGRGPRRDRRERSPISMSSRNSPTSFSTTPRASVAQGAPVAFAKARNLGGAEKAIIFTESRRTQQYLLRVLADSSARKASFLFNGSNTDDSSKAIYGAWRRPACRAPIASPARARPTCARRWSITSATAAQIMIATEAGAEGINLQFCSLVVNYDLPWNPQRIEQRIGRCHRYGQKHDVVVVNFLNRKNAADQRVFELLSEKFKLFEGVFGASDEVLGAIESGVDFEKRIARSISTAARLTRSSRRSTSCSSSWASRSTRHDHRRAKSCSRTSTTRCARSSRCATPNRPRNAAASKSCS